MAAQGIDDLQGDNGLQCIQQLLEEYELKKEEAAALQQLLADSNSQIQAARSRALQLQETLVRMGKGGGRGREEEIKPGGLHWSRKRTRPASFPNVPSPPPPHLSSPPPKGHH